MVFVQKIKFIYTLLLIVFCAFSLDAQTKSQLEERRRTLLREIEETAQQLEQTRKDKEQILQSYNTLQNKIGKRQEVMATLSLEVKNAQGIIENSILEVDILQKEIQKLQIEYSNILKKAYKMHLGMSDFLFVFSSSSINQAFKRWQYLKQIKRFRDNQANIIIAKQDLLIQKIQMLENNKVSKKSLLDLEQQQNSLLADELKQKDIIIQNLRQDESRLKAELVKRKNDQKKLAAEIEKIIAAEIKRKRAMALEKSKAATKKSKKKSTKKSQNAYEETEITDAPEVVALSDNFDSNKGRLPWPVQRGTIVKGFGGMQLKGDKLSFYPMLPKEWDSYSFRINFRSNTIEVKVGKDEIIFSNLNGDDLNVEVYGETIQLKSLQSTKFVKRSVMA
jgi:septal ring factor EnvC (AmiA/AmiB activator)